MTVEEYLALEESSGERHEFLNGIVWAMSGGTYAHDQLSTAMAAELRAALSGKACAAGGPNLRVKSLESGLYSYADALVVCEPRFEDARRTTLLNPRVIVEVLSEGTEAYDRGEKFAHYRAIESIGDYVLVSTSATVVEVYARCRRLGAANLSRGRRHSSAYGGRSDPSRSALPRRRARSAARQG